MTNTEADKLVPEVENQVSGTDKRIKVSLIDSECKEDRINKMYFAFRTCASNKTSKDLTTEVIELDFSKKVKFLEDNFKKKHLSLAEFTDFTFSIEGIPLYIAEQILRHRHLSFAKKSFRYVVIQEKLEELEEHISAEGNTKYEEISDKYFYNPYTHKNPERIALNILNLRQYLKEVKYGGKNENARGILPTSLRTSMVIKGNLRTFIEICQKRLCRRTQGLNRDIFESIKKYIIEYTGLSESLFTPDCSVCEDTCEFPYMKLKGN